MPLNKVKPGSNMYGFITHTWNPLAGRCSHACTYCSSHKFYYPELIKKYSGPLRLCEHYFNDNLGSGKFIFVVGQNDLFTDYIPIDWIIRVLAHCNKFDNSYLFQTKNPRRFKEFINHFPQKSAFCTTIETNRYYSQMGNAPAPEERADSMYGLDGATRYVTIEPIMDFDLCEMVDLIYKCVPDKVNIGADSGHNNLCEPSKNKIDALISELQLFTKIDRKSNLERLL